MTKVDNGDWVIQSLAGLPESDFPLSKLALASHKNAAEHGFWEGDWDIEKLLTKLALIHSEVSELLEALRKEKSQEEVEGEVADIFIRTFDLYAGLIKLGLVKHTLDFAVEHKMAINKDRPFKHNVLA